MAQPFRIGVMQLTMEPLEEMLESARVMDRAGMDTIWLAEAYPWWRKHGMEARSSTVVSGLIAKATERLTVGWGIISPFTRHPVQVAMDARVVQEAAGPGRFLLGFGTSKIFLNNARINGKRTLGPMRDAVEIVRGVLGGQPFVYEGDTWSADVPGLQDDAVTPRAVPPVYVAATAPKMQTFMIIAVQRNFSKPKPSANGGTAAIKRRLVQRPCSTCPAMNIAGSCAAAARIDPITSSTA